MFDLAESWVWDFWLAVDGPDIHLFFLHAPSSLGDPDLRHRSARIGHAVSRDLVAWERLPDPLPEGRAGFDDLAQWTGCVVLDDAGGWRMFTTGLARSDDGRVQRIGSARSDDLVTWRRDDLLLEADPALYEVDPALLVHWRDPWVVHGAGGWHLYATARTGGPGSGVVGHAVSSDLESWTVLPALSAPTGRFDWLEVISLVEVEGRWVALFNCLSGEMPGAEPGGGGIWTVPVTGPGEPVDVGSATRLTGEASYVGKVVDAPDGRWRLISFRHDEGLGIQDPRAVRWRADGRGLELEGGHSPPSRLP
jgi:beta-fructofuranosidase